MAKKRSRKADDETKEAEVPAKGKASRAAPEKPPAQKPAAPKPRPKPKTDEERKKIQIEGIKKTVYPAVLGVIAGFICFYALGISTVFPWHFVLVVFITITYILQKFTYPLLGIDPLEFKGKDWFYVEFIAVDLWLVTWTLLLN